MSGAWRKALRAEKPTPPTDPVDLVIRRDFGFDPEVWPGPLRLLVAGKAGELFFASGTIPALRRRLPRARLVLHCVEHYAPMVRRFAYAPDELVVSPVDAAMGLAKSVSAAVTDHGGFFVHEDGGLAVELYRTHPWFGAPHQTKGTFYQAFSEAACIPRDEYTPPEWSVADTEADDAEWSGGFVIAFPTANPHSSTVGGLRFSAAKWAAAAERARRKGLVPIATGHIEDGEPSGMPGWQWKDWPLVRLVNAIWLGCRGAVGCNSGILFLAGRALHMRRAQGLAVSPALMVDSTPFPYLAHLFDPARMDCVHVQQATSLDGWP
jgi:hypothetical protein